MTLVVDASTVVAALVDSGTNGQWAETLLTSDLAAPQLLHVEVASVLRRAAHSGDISEDTASLAYVDLLDLRVELVAFDAVAHRVWQLRHNVTAYDAWYVATAELLEAPLATLDERLVGSTGPRCSFRTPDN